MPLKTSRIIDELLGIMIYVAGLVASKMVLACGVGTVDLGYDHGRLNMCAYYYDLYQSMGGGSTV
ncbi:hypothetical protein M422DRAFT_261730 [Sphaerobolus stellatus SS14]|uniref:Uncharacterized protein n=1 Tax=Sphaerobolus stellatus (strain SS14) TaxID=990650 RepID=A0A0C9TZZ9_SPHS4|nr:hypothetical protein M422DRAFT_261730 [Sphaerobolus stellatus SS14]